VENVGCDHSVESVRLEAVALLREFNPPSALCNLTDLFVKMAIHKVGLWNRVPE
jgi:hypothetical protein